MTPLVNPSSPAPESDAHTAPEHVHDNIQAVHALHQTTARRVRRGQRVVESVTGFLGFVRGRHDHDRYDNAEPSEQGGGAQCALGTASELAGRAAHSEIIAQLEELRRDLPNVRDRVDPAADALQQAVPATAVSSALDHTMHPHLMDKGPPNPGDKNRSRTDSSAAERHGSCLWTCNLSNHGTFEVPDRTCNDRNQT